MAELCKLNIKAYTDNTFGTEAGAEFKTLINPAHIQISNVVNYKSSHLMGKGDVALKYDTVEPRELSFKLIFDKTGVFGEATATVSEEVSLLEKVTSNFQSDISQPYYIRVIWGTIDFKGKLIRSDTHYSHFQTDGSPTHAEVDLTILEDSADHGDGNQDADNIADADVAGASSGSNSLKSLTSGLSSGLSSLTSGLSSLLSSLDLSSILSTLASALSSLLSLLAALASGLLDLLKKLWDWLKNLVKKGVAWLKSKTVDKVKGVLDKASNWWDKAKDVAATGVGKAGEFASGALDVAKGGINAGVEGAKGLGDGKGPKGPKKPKGPKGADASSEGGTAEKKPRRRRPMRGLIGAAAVTAGTAAAKKSRTSRLRSRRRKSSS